MCRVGLVCLLVHGFNRRLGERVSAVHDALAIQDLDLRTAEVEHFHKNLGRVLANRRRATPDTTGGERHLRHHTIDTDGHAGLRIVKILEAASKSLAERGKPETIE